MYMGVILNRGDSQTQVTGAPHVYGGDPVLVFYCVIICTVLPMYMGVIPLSVNTLSARVCAPHVYGGDPLVASMTFLPLKCSPCIWG